MKKTKIISTVASFALTVSMITGMTSNGIVGSGYELNEEEYADCIKLDEEDFVITWRNDPLEHYIAQYFETLDNGLALIYRVDKQDDQLRIEAHSQEDFEKLKKLIADIDERYIIEQLQPHVSGKIPFILRIENGDGEFNEISREELNNLRDVCSDYTDSMIYSGGWYADHRCYMRDFTDYGSFMTDEMIETLKKYVEETSLDVEVIEYTEGGNNCIKLVPNDELTTYEHFQLARKIAKDTGIFRYPTGHDYQYLTHSDKVCDLKKFVDGDTNEDGELTIADSVAVLQSIGNPDKYALSAQAEFNADVDGIDGITGTDAFVIQQMELNSK